jgi:hypothetical protein
LAVFDLLFHADWSVAAKKRWMAVAEQRTTGWVVEAPELVGPTGSLLDRAFSAASEGRRVLVGFDFPIGVPAAYGNLTELGNFRNLLNALGQGAWSRFFEVAKTPDEISVGRPFYPAASTKGVLRNDLVAALGVAGFDDLLRVCERRTAHRQSACSLFWTLGGNQVGKGALSGWREIILPALQRGALLWPFDGALLKLAGSPGVVLAETYPAEAYRMVDARFCPGESKTRQNHRKTKSDPVLAWAERREIVFSADASAALASGYGSGKDGEDRFDATMGLLKMIEVVENRRPEQTEQPTGTSHWEGWILGR